MKTQPKIKKVTIDIIEDEEVKQEEITIKKATLGKWAKLTTTIRKLIDSLPNMLDRLGIKEEDREAFLTNLTADKVVGFIPELLDIILDEFINIVALGADLEPSYVEENIGLDDALILFEAIVEVNSFKKEAVEVGKKLIAQLTEKLKK